jgi:stringent starvation protein B
MALSVVSEGSMGTGQEKRDAFEKMLDLGKVMLHLDARRFGVDVPDDHRDQHHLRLDFSYRFRLDVFQVNERGVTASLSFKGRNYLCKIPWTAVFGMYGHVNGQFLLWPEDAPAELLPTGTDDESAEEDLADDSGLEDARTPVGHVDSQSVMLSSGPAGDSEDGSVVTALRPRSGGLRSVPTKVAAPKDDGDEPEVGAAVRRIGHLRVIK